MKSLKTSLEYDSLSIKNALRFGGLREGFSHSENFTKYPERAKTQFSWR